MGYISTLEKARGALKNDESQFTGDEAVGCTYHLRSLHLDRAPITAFELSLTADVVTAFAVLLPLSAPLALRMATTPSDLPEQTPPNIASASEPPSEHLSFPAQTEPAAPVASSSTPAQPRTLLRDRLYVGNLHSSVDE